MDFGDVGALNRYDTHKPPCVTLHGAIPGAIPGAHAGDQSRVQKFGDAGVLPIVWGESVAVRGLSWAVLGLSAAVLGRLGWS